MRLSAVIVSLRKQAPRILGAVFCAFSLLASSACNKKGQTPDWVKPPEQPQVATAQDDLSAVKPVAGSTDDQSSRGLTFITYNVENWLTEDRYIDGKPVKGRPKPESQKQAIVQILARHSPDVVGLCEIGTAADLAEIQEKLKAAGLELPHSHYTGGADPIRHLGLLSRFPITATANATETVFQLAGKTFAINRGILDATITANHRSYRFIGAHLKSKRDSEQGDQDGIRLNEARLLRRHVDSILQNDANAQLVVYGDFNDTRASPTIRLIAGNYRSHDYLTAISSKDSRDETWTHYWSLHDIYSRIDFIMVSHSLHDEVDASLSKIIDDAEWDEASDHRAVMAVFK